MTDSRGAVVSMQGHARFFGVISFFSFFSITRVFLRFFSAITGFSAIKVLALGAVLVFLTAGGLPGKALGAQQDTNWVWHVLVAAPPGGWETDAGRSVRAVLSWHEMEIDESGSGIRGHDLRFVCLPPMDEAAAADAALSADKRTVAVMSFAAPEVDPILIEKTAPLRLPLLLAGGEEVPLHRGGRLLPFVFALDLFRDYRSAAFAAYAVKTLKPEDRLALMGSRFTVDQEREAKLFQSLLLDADFMPMPYWVDASVTDTFALIAEEVESAEPGALVCFMGNMAAKELWRAFMRTRTPWRLWQCGKPDPSFLSFRGMIFADQNLLLEERGAFQDLKRRLWNTRTLQVSDAVAAGRADALAQWLIQGLEALPGPLESLDRPALLDRLSRAERIPFGNQLLDVNPELHRPRQRQVYILEVRDRSYTLLDTLPVQGPAYFSY